MESIAAGRGEVRKVNDILCAEVDWRRVWVSDHNGPQRVDDGGVVFGAFECVEQQLTVG